MNYLQYLKDGDEFKSVVLNSDLWQQQQNSSSYQDPFYVHKNDVPLSWTDPIGEFFVLDRVMGKPIELLAKPIILAGKKLVSKALKKLPIHKVKLEMKERCDRFEDAIMATKCAMIGGILPGGGLSLANVMQRIPLEIKLENVLKAPYQKIWNCQFTPNNIDLWINSAEQDFYNLGIIDPFLVTKTTLENAIAVASTILTTNCTILNV